MELLDVLSADDRCKMCFAPLASELQSRCDGCHKTGFPWNHAASVFEYLGPGATLVKRLKYGGQLHLARSAAAFMVAQMYQLQWPLPDVIVPVPMPFLRRVIRGYNQSYLIAEEMGKMLQRPVENALKRLSGDFAQAGRSLKQRQQLSSNRFQLRRSMKIADRTILLVDDVFTTGTTLRYCAEALLGGCPKEINALAVCRTTH